MSELKEWIDLMNSDTIDEIKDMIKSLEGTEGVSGSKVSGHHMQLLQKLEYSAPCLKRDEVLIFLKDKIAACDTPQENDDDSQEEN